MTASKWSIDGQVYERLLTIECFQGLTPQQIQVQRLGGLTNINYRVETPSGRFVLRLPGPGTLDYIDRQAEEHNAQSAADAGVNAEVIHFDSEDGCMVCRYVEGAVTMSIEAFRDLGAVERAGRVLRRLHDTSAPFCSDFGLFSQMDRYLALLKKLEAPLPEGFDCVRRDAQAVRAALERWDLPQAPCHCDPLYENFLDVGDRMYLIDFEYAGNNDPMWDLGDLSVESEFTAEQDQQLLNAYFDRGPKPFDVARMSMYKALSDLLWTLWGVVQHANQNPADDFWAYAVNRLRRCRNLMATSEFRSHLEVVQGGPQSAG